MITNVKISCSYSKWFESWRTNSYLIRQLESFQMQFSSGAILGNERMDPLIISIVSSSVRRVFQAFQLSWIFWAKAWASCSRNFSVSQWHLLPSAGNISGRNEACLSLQICSYWSRFRVAWFWSAELGFVKWTKADTNRRICHQSWRGGVKEGFFLQLWWTKKNCIRK